MILSRQDNGQDKWKGGPKIGSERQKRKDNVPTCLSIKGASGCKWNAPKGKPSVKGQTKGWVKGLKIQSQGKAHKVLSDARVPTPLPVQLVVVSQPAGTSMTMRSVASTQSPPAELVSPNSLAVMVRRMKEAALTNGTSEPTLDEIEVEYQHAHALRCAAGL